MAYALFNNLALSATRENPFTANFRNKYTKGLTIRCGKHCKFFVKKRKNGIKRFSPKI
jgi:hypothetical protein